MAFLTNGRTGRRGFEWARAEHQRASGLIDAPTTPGRPQPDAGPKSTKRSTPWWKPRGGRLRLVLVGNDLTAVALAWLVTLGATGALLEVPVWSVALATFVAVVAVAFAARWGLYLSRVSTVRSAELAALLRVSVVASAIGWVAARAVGRDVWWVPIVAAGVLSFLFLAAARSSFDAWIKSRRRAGEYCREILLVGRDEAAVELLELVEDQPELGYRIVGYVGPEVSSDDAFAGMRVGGYEDIPNLVGDQKANGVLVAASALGDRRLRSVLCDLVEDGVHVQLSTGLQGLDHRRLRASTVGYEAVLYLERPASSAWDRHAKRAMDIVIGGLLLLLALPVLAVAAIAIKLHDRGPIFFRQVRIGRGGHPFQLLKLRTMETDAESRLAALTLGNERNGPLFKLSSDPRVTPPGRLLRASSLDELPQLINVLRGEMSLVGPRPPLPTEFDQFDAELQQRQQLTPGITGLWQLEARDNPSFRTYRRLDLYYLRNWSMSLDLMILLLTAYSVVIRAITSSDGDDEEPAIALADQQELVDDCPSVTVA